MIPRTHYLSFLLCAAGMLGGCSSTSLDVAPVVDLSSTEGAPPAAAPAVPAAPVDGVVVVKPGDTLFHLALANHVGMHDLARWNQIDESAPLRVGQTLVVRDPALSRPQTPGAAPSSGGGGDSAGTDEAAVKVSPIAPVAGAGQARPLGAVVKGSDATGAAAGGESLKSADAAVPVAPVPVAPVPVAPGPLPAVDKPDWVWPVDGEVVQPFDAARQKGIFIAVAPDAPVRAVADGTVSYVGTYLDYGKLVIITHDDRLRTVYGQNKTLVVKQGQTVRRGEMIATAGGSRGDVGTRFRFEVRLKGTPVDPLPYLPAR